MVGSRSRHLLEGSNAFPPRQPLVRWSDRVRGRRGERTRHVSFRKSGDSCPRRPSSGEGFAFLSIRPSGKCTIASVILRRSLRARTPRMRSRTPKVSGERMRTMGTQHTRRRFLGNVGRGMLVASVGFGTAFDMELTPAWADDDGGERLAFGGLEPLVGLMQETPIRKLVPVLVEKLRAGDRAQAARGRRGAGERADVRRRGLRRLPHPDGPRPRLSHGAGAARRPSRAAGASRSSTATRTGSRNTAAAPRRCCTRSSRACSRPVTSPVRPYATPCAGRT